jgi:hypothetical protein
MNRNLTTDALSAFFPFTSQFLEVDDTGVWMGLNKNKIPIIKDIFKLSNPNGVVLAQSGGGKSYFCKLLITRYLLNGTKTLVIDPQGEYRALIAYFGGQRVDLSRNSDTMINPLDLMGHDYTEKRLSLVDLMQVMLGDLSEPQKAFIDKAISLAYEEAGITEDSSTWSFTPPILGDVLKKLELMEKKAIQLEKSTLRSLINRLDMYVSGVFRFMNKHTNIEFNNRLVCFDIGNMPPQVKPAIMFIVLDYIYMKMKRDLDRKILLIDEAWSLLSRTEDAGYIFEIVKTCRKFNLGLLLINQEVEGLLSSQAGKSVLANSAYTLLMRQKPAVIDSICKTFHLSDSERNHLLTANIGEGLLIMEDDHTEIKVVASPEEHKIITTNADELNAQKDKGAKLSIKSNTSKLPDKTIEVTNLTQCYKEKELKSWDVKYLLNKGYKRFKLKSLSADRKEDYLIKPRIKESVNHSFVVYDIARYLQSKGISVETFASRKPDVIFEINGKKIALEVESGAVLKYNKKAIEEKLQILKKESDDWYFVVLHYTYASKYNPYGKVIDIRYLKKALKKIIE